MALLMSALITLLKTFSRKDPEPYHTSGLTRQAWVLELLTGHPQCICCELGMYWHVFVALIEQLRAFGHTDSQHVSLEEQLSIFLYTCVTSLTI